MINCTIILEAHDGFVKHMLIPFPPPLEMLLPVYDNLLRDPYPDGMPRHPVITKRCFYRTAEVYAGVYLYKEV